MPGGIHYYRRSIRRPGYDHTQVGAYYITICTHERRHLFGNVVNTPEGAAMTDLTAIGGIVRGCWDAIPEHMPHADVDAFVVVASFRSAATRIAYRDGVIPRATPVWQRNYHDRIIRTEEEHIHIAQYIADNPKNWMRDRFNDNRGR
jgi:putative transposase